LDHQIDINTQTVAVSIKKKCVTFFFLLLATASLLSSLL